MPMCSLADVIDPNTMVIITIDTNPHRPQTGVPFLARGWDRSVGG
jgi:hypothetical protein